MITVGDLTPAKLMKALKTGKISFSKNDLMGNDYQMLMHPVSAKKVKKAMKLGRGINSVPITRGEIENDLNYHSMSGSGLKGGSIWKKIWNGIKSIWNPVIKPALSAALDVAAPALGTYTGQPALTTALRSGVKNLTGVGMSGMSGMSERMAKVRAAKKSNKVNVLTAGSFKIN